MGCSKALLRFAAILSVLALLLLTPGFSLAQLSVEPEEDSGGADSPSSPVVTAAFESRAPRFSHPAVSGDGKVVAFLEQSAAAPVTDLRVCAWERGEWTLPVTLLSLPAETAARPAMSADGRTLAIAGDRRENGYAIWTVDRPGEVWADPQELPFLVLHPWVSLDRHGQLLAFIGEASGSPQVHAVRRIGLGWGERELVSDPRQGPASHPYLAPDGKSLVFVQRNRLVLAQAVEGGWTASEWRGTAATGGALLWPALSADGSTAFVWRITARDGKKVKELFVVSREGASHRLRRIGGPSAFREQDTGPAGVDAAGSTVVFSVDDMVMTSRREENNWISSSLPTSPGAVSIPALAADGETVVWAGGDPRCPAASAVLATKLVKSPVISLPTPQLEFGSVNLDSSSTRSFTIKNVGKAKLKITRLQFDGGSGGPFVLGKVKLPSSVSPNKTLTIKVTYTPRELTESSALLWITSNDKVSPVVGEILRGTGTWPAPVLTSISPTEGDEGSSATLQGSGFGTTASLVSVTVSGGYILDAAVGSVSDKSMSVKIPTGFCAWKKYQDALVWVTVRGVQSGGAYFRLTNLMPCEPAIVLTDPHAGGIGDPVTLKAYGLPAELDRILVSFNGAVTHPESIRPDWDPELAYITARVPEGATTGPLRLKRTDGVDRWSQPADFTVLEPTPLVLAAGDEADGIVVPVVTFDIGLPSEHTQEYGPAPWRLGGAYLTRIRASLDHPPGTLNLEVSTPNGTATTELMAAGDTVGIANRPPWTLFKGMKPGDTFTVRASGYELYSRVVRQSPWLTLTVGRVLHPGTATVINSAFELPVRDGRLAMAQGDTLLVAGSYRDEALSAAGLWNGTVTLNQYAHPFALASGQLFSTLVLLDQPGTFTVANQTTGQSIQVDVFAAGNNSASYADNNRGFAFGEALAREGVILGCGGARLTIPPGALPARQTDPEHISEYYYVSCAHNPEIRPFADATIGDAGHSLAIGIDPTPPELLKPITIEMPYTLEGRFSPPDFGVYDPATQLYFKLTGAEDDGSGHLRLTLPARRYPEEPAPAVATASRTATGTQPATVPDTTLDKIVGGLGVYSAKNTNPTLTDETRKLIVDYISDPSSSSHVSDAYAQETFTTAQQTYDLLVAQGWPRPDGWFGGWLTLSIRTPWVWTSQHGSTSAGVLGQPWITINPAKTSQGANLKTTVAHEMGHAFQRQLTTNATAKWFDEASANAIAWMLLGVQADLGTDISSFPTLPAKSVPGGFYLGYSTEEGYAAGSFAIWMEKTYPKSILKTYQALPYDPRYWSDSYRTFAEATGASGGMSTLVAGWGKWFWTQQESPVSALDFGHLAPQITDWSGVTIQQSRPQASSDRADVSASSAFAPQLRGKDLVASFRTDGNAQEVTIYGDTHICTSPPGTLTELAMMNPLTQAAKKLGPHGAYACYRVVVTNYDLSDPAAVVVRIYPPHINTIYPSSGSRSGGYPLELNGSGFGTSGTYSQVTVEGWNCPVTSWSDARITCRMPSLPFTGPHLVQVQTQEFAKTNTLTFTAN